MHKTMTAGEFYSCCFFFSLFTCAGVGEYEHQSLQERGHTVQAIRLPGHGTSPEDMIRTEWTDWYGHVLNSYDELASLSFDRIIVMGHSMGGLLALKLAAECKVDGLVSLATPIYFTTRKIILAEWMQYFVRYVEKGRFNPIE